MFIYFLKYFKVLLFSCHSPVKRLGVYEAEATDCRESPKCVPGPEDVGRKWQPVLHGEMCL